MIEQIAYNGEIYAIIIRDGYNEPGITFITPNELSQQVAYMKHSKGKSIEPHTHNPVVRKVVYTQEVLIVKKGILRVDFYNENNHYQESILLRAGDTILLIQGGHGFEVVEDVEMIEVKQGPYTGEADKTRFCGVFHDQLKVRD